jgi:hypothetical protein
MSADVFSNVVSLVSKGLTIRQALSEVGVSATVFYKNCTDQQKSELKALKISMSIHGRPGKYNLTNYARLGIEPNFFNETEE